MFNYSIYCTKQTWASTTQEKDINIFSDVSPTIDTPILLSDYLIDISEIEYSFEETNYINYTNLIYKEASDINLKTSGIKNINYLKSYFQILEDTSFIKFLIEIKDSNSVTLYKGIVNQDALKEQFTDDDDNKIIEIQVLGFEKEFKSYYTEKKLIDEESITWEGNINIPSGAILPHPVLPVKKLENLLKNDLFNSVNLDFLIESNIANSYISKLSCFYYSGINALNTNKQIGTPQSESQDFMKQIRGVKNQMLYTASEMISAGITAGDINELQLFMNNEQPETGFNYINYPKISIKHTSLTSLTDFETSGFNQCYYISRKNLNTAGQHWESFVFQNNFTWNGTDNIIIEFCYYYKNYPDAIVYVENGISGKWLNKQLALYSYGGCEETSGASVMATRPAIKVGVGSYSAEVGIFIKNSYERLVTQGMSCFEFLEKLSNSMGWNYSFVQDKLIIKNMDSRDIPIEEISYNNFIKYNVSKKSFRKLFKNVVIPDGAIICGSEVNPYDGLADKISGERIHLLSINENEIQTMWFVNAAGSGGVRYSLWSDTGIYFYKEVTTDDDADKKITWQKLYADTVFSYTTEDTDIYLDDLLIIDGGVNSNAYMVDCYNGDNGENLTAHIDYNMAYTGNLGNIIIQLDENNYLVETYLSYCKRVQFRNNFSKYLKSSQNVVLKIEYSGLLTDPYKIFQITDNTELNGLWYLTKLKINLLENKTNLTLIKSLN